MPSAPISSATVTDAVGFDPEHGDRGISVLERHGDEVVGELRLSLQPRDPELAVTPGAPDPGLPVDEARLQIRRMAATAMESFVPLTEPET